MLIIATLAGLACLLLLAVKGKEDHHPAKVAPPPAPQLIDLLEDDAPDGKSEYYRTVQRCGRIARKTYLLGRLQGKYRGTISAHRHRQQDDPFIYDLEIYEAAVELEPAADCCCITSLKTACNGLHTGAEGRFEEQDEAAFPRERLTLPIRAILKQEDTVYDITIYEPALSRVKLLSRLHQTDDGAVFGTIDAYISGTMLDFITEEYAERLILKNTGIATLAPLPDLRPSLPLIRMPAP